MSARKIILKFSNVMLLIIIIIAAAILSPDFFALGNIINVVRQMTVLGLLALGMTFVILVGNMDLSVGANMTFTGLLAISFQKYMPPISAIILALVIGILIGCINGFVIVITKANSGESLMMTLGTQMVLMASSLLYTKGFALDGSESKFYNEIGTGMINKVLPIPVIILVAFTIILSVIESKSALGRSIHMIGYNREASRLAGLNTGPIRVFCYAMSGFMAACAAIVLSSRTLGATPTAGVGYEMDAIVAIVLGGTSLSGGSGSIVKTFVGILTLGVLGNIMNLLGFAASDQMYVKGIVLILAVSFDYLNRKQLVKA
jgi:ribose transport system permease protein